MSIGLLSAVRAYPVYFKTRFGIHTFFMKFAIDVLILDSTNRVVFCIENMAPFRFFVWNPIYNKVIELPSGTIQKQKINKGDTIKLILLTPAILHK